MTFGGSFQPVTRFATEGNSLPFPKLLTINKTKFQAFERLAGSAALNKIYGGTCVNSVQSNKLLYVHFMLTEVKLNRFSGKFQHPINQIAREARKLVFTSGQPDYCKSLQTDETKISVLTQRLYATPITGRQAHSSGWSN